MNKYILYIFWLITFYVVYLKDLPPLVRFITNTIVFVILLIIFFRVFYPKKKKKTQVLRSKNSKLKSYLYYNYYRLVVNLFWAYLCAMLIVSFFTEIPLIMAYGFWFVSGIFFAKELVTYLYSSHNNSKENS